MVFKEVIIFTCLAGIVSGGGGVKQFRGPIVGSQAIGPVGGGCVGAGCAVDFNPILLQGIRGYPGIRARINLRTFQYASGLIAQVLNQEIKKARIPPISQCIPQVQGCAQIYNLYVSRYRCPQRVVLFPAPPNRIVLRVENVDIGVTGNLGGQIVVLLPIPLTGIIQLNVQQVTITVDMSMERGPSGPYVRVLSCDVRIGYADAYIENGGLIGYIINSQFRQRITSQVKEMIPGKICDQLPSIVNEKLNSRLAGLPQLIAVTQMLSMFSGALPFGGGAASSPSPQFCQTQCRGVAPPGTASPIVPPSTIAAQPAPSGVAPIPTGVAPSLAPQIPQTAYGGPVAHGIQQKIYHTNQVRTLKKAIDQNFAPVAYRHRQYRSVMYQQESEQKLLTVPMTRTKRDVPRFYRIANLPTTPYRSAMLVRTARGGRTPQAPFIRYTARPAAAYRPGSPKIAPPPPVPGAPRPMLVPPPASLCAKCPASGTSDDPVSFLRQLAANLDLRKLSNLYLSVQVLSTQATSNDFTVNLSGEFSENGRGGTPFGAFPVSFPYAYDSHMAEFILSDYTINTLFYQLHRKQFLTFRIGPDTPKIGELLKTTCSEDEEDELEGTEVELDEKEEMRRLRKALWMLKKLRSKRSTKERGKRQNEASALADLGICFGDILPAVREKYPNQKIAIIIRTARAPSVILSQAQGGTLILDLIADADIYIDGTNNRVGTITIATTVVVVAQLHGNRLVGSAMITNLKLTDRAGTLGLPQDALDNLGNLGKELLQKLANDALKKGVQVNIPTGSVAGLPINIINPTIRIIEHGLYIATDLTISPSLLGITSQC